MAGSVTWLRTDVVPVDSLTPMPGNPRRGVVEEIRGSIRRHGQYRSLVVRDTGEQLVILAGNHTLKALVAEGHTEVRCEIVQCDDDTARRINIGDNRLHDLGGYDDDELTRILQELPDLDATGYTGEDLDELLRATDALGDPAASFLDPFRQQPPTAPPAAPAAGVPPAPPYDAPADSHTTAAGAPAAPPPPGTGTPPLSRPEDGQPAAQEAPQPTSHPAVSDAPPAAPGAIPPPPSTASPQDLVPISWTVTVAERDRIRGILRKAQGQLGVPDASTALVQILDQYAATHLQESASAIPKEPS
ncbi:ParB/RepB/Spo0J family partition protein [Actinomadura miaoliensis]|uniref:ParB-like N-terminal domain-containing protein n=1 Tax=Actinomadura miaoliensis TaxID=430685 RepID=A0ABP7WBA9_9ACTN